MMKKNKQKEKVFSNKTSQASISLERLNEKIKEVARGLYEKRGCVPGHELDDWLEAERLVKG